ncbi:hypothetical protein FHW79_005955 [Azospirillum sp. OGB3]|nr:hypothetical protein [Azospirillum sp. OGB3]
MHAAACNSFNLQRHLISRRALRTFRERVMADRRAPTSTA